MMVGGEGNMMVVPGFYGGSHYPDWSDVGNEFVDFMRVKLEQFEMDGFSPSRRDVTIWNGRAISLLPKKGGTHVHGEVSGMKQFNTGVQFNTGTTTTGWYLSITFASAADARKCGGVPSSTTVEYELVRCDVRNGGTCFSRNRSSKTLFSFLWRGVKPAIERCPPLEDETVPRIATVDTAGKCERMGEMLEAEERYAEIPASIGSRRGWLMTAGTFLW